MSFKKERYIKDNRGMSLISIMVVLGIVAIVITGTTTMISNIARYQRHVTLVKVLETMVGNFERNVKDRAAWSQTVADATNGTMDCLRTATDTCAEGIFDIDRLYSATGVFWDSTDASNGLTIRGDNCTNFNAAGGNFDCPISYNVQWQAVCPAAAPCRHPRINVIVQMLWRPGAGGGGIPAINEDLYSRTIFRFSGEINEPFVFQHIVTVSESGSCGVAFANRPLELQAPGGVDPYGNAAEDGSGMLLQPGTYSCQAEAAGFGVDGFRIRLVDSGGNNLLGEEGHGFSVGAVQDWARVSGEFNIEAEETVFLQQACQEPGLGPPPSGLGRTAAGVSDVLAIVSCTRLN